MTMDQRTTPLSSSHLFVFSYSSVLTKHASENASLDAPPSSPAVRSWLLKEPKFLRRAIRRMSAVSWPLAHWSSRV